MNEESKEMKEKGTYSALCGSLEAETGVIWGDGNEGWNVFD